MRMEGEGGDRSPHAWGRGLSMQLETSAAGAFLCLTRVGEGRSELGVCTQILVLG